MNKIKMNNGIDDSGIVLDKEYHYEDVPEKTLFEIDSFKNGIKVILYLINEDNIYKEKPKAFATHILEQVFDENNVIVSEIIKPFKYEDD